MKSKDPRKHTETQSLCANVHPDDGPQKSRRKESRNTGSDDRKTMQLCAEVKRTLHSAISFPGSSYFDELMIEAVEPDPDASRLRVVISVPGSNTHPITSIRKHLSDMAGFFRSEIAARINRKRVPTLTFDLIPREDEI